MARHTSMSRYAQEEWAVEYLAANLAAEEVQNAETSITVQAFADFFAARWPTFNKMHFAERVRRQATQGVPQGIGDTKKERSVQMFDRLFTLPRR